MGKAAQDRGYQFEDTFQKSFKAAFPEGFIYKLIDTHSLEGAKRAAGDQWGNFIVPKVVSDFICLNSGEHIFVECKNTMNKTSFPLGNIKDHQFQFAIDVENAGGRYLFAIRRWEARKHECFLVSVNDIINMKQQSQYEKSIKWDIFRDNNDIKKPGLIKGSMFDISNMFD